MADVEKWLPPVANILGTIMSAGSQVQAGRTTSQVGQAQQRIAQNEAAELDRYANQEIAASHRASAEERRVANLASSRAQALAAASGAGGPTVARIISGLAGEGAYRSAVQLYEGEQKARGIRAKAYGVRQQGDLEAAMGESRQAAYNTAAGTSLIRGAGSLFEKYGMGGPKKTNPLADPVYQGDWLKWNEGP